MKAARDVAAGGLYGLALALLSYAFFLRHFG